MIHQTIGARIGVAVLLAAILTATAGLTAGLFVVGVGALLAASGWTQGALGGGGRADTIRFALIATETLIVGAALFVANPFDGHPPPPAPMVFFSPALLGLLCLLALNAVQVRPVLTWWSGATILILWTAARFWVLADPATLTGAQVHDDDYATALEYLAAVTRPHFFNKDVWVLQMAAVAGCTAILGVASQRLNGLARRAALREASRAGLAAHFSAPVVDALLKAGPETLSGGGDLTILDCDLTGYSGVAARLNPEAAADLLRAYHGFVEAQVFEAGGAVLKFTGDGITAAFGLAQPPESAARAALDCAERVVRGWPAVVGPFDLADAPGIAVGVDSGPANWGVVGEGRALSLVIVGPPVEAAAKLQEATRREKVALLVGPQTARLAAPPGNTEP